MDVEVTSMRIKSFDEEGNNSQLKINLDCLDKVRTKASQRTMKYQQKMVGYYNQRMKLRRFDIGNLVQHKITSETKDPTQGKLGPT